MFIVTIKTPSQGPFTLKFYGLPEAELFFEASLGGSNGVSAKIEKETRFELIKSSGSW